MPPGRLFNLAGWPRKRRHLLLAGIFMPVIFACSPPAQAEKSGPGQNEGAAKLEGYLLKQECKTVGSQAITVTARGIRCEALRSHIVVMAGPPNWSVLIYNPTTLRSKTTDYKLFRGYLQRQMVLFANTSYNDKPCVLAQKKTFFGFPGFLYKEPPGYRTILTPRYYKKELEGSEACEVTYKTISLPGIPPQAESLLARFYLLPEKPGVPVEFSYESITHDRRTFLSTFQVTRQAVDPALLKPPAGLKPCRTMEEVFIDGSAEGSDELINMFQKK